MLLQKIFYNNEFGHFPPFTIKYKQDISVHVHVNGMRSWHSNKPLSVNI